MKMKFAFLLLCFFASSAFAEKNSAYIGSSGVGYTYKFNESSIGNQSLLIEYGNFNYDLGWTGRKFNVKAEWVRFGLLNSFDNGLEVGAFLNKEVVSNNAKDNSLNSMISTEINYAPMAAYVGYKFPLSKNLEFKTGVYYIGTPTFVIKSSNPNVNLQREAATI